MAAESTKPKTLDEGGKNIVALMVALLVAIFAFQLNASMLSPALVAMQNELNTTATEIGNTQTVFFTAAALFSLFLPRLADIVGRKKVLSGMLLITAIGCIVSAAAQDVTMLMVGRIMQGVAGPVVPMCLIMLHTQVTEEARYTKLMAILTSVNGGIAGVDAILGGWLAGNFGFRSVFICMAVVAVLAVVLVWFCSKESKAEGSPKMDWAGVVTLGIAFLSAYLAINEIQKLAKADLVMVAVLVVVAAVFFVVFWNIEKKKDAPMVSTHYLKQRRTWGLLLTTLLTMTGVFAIMNGVVPAIAQDEACGVAMGADVVSFATLTPYALLGLCFGPVAGIFCQQIRLPRRAARGSRGVHFGRAVRHFRRAQHEHRHACRDFGCTGHFLCRHRKHHAERPGHRAFPERQYRLPAGHERRRVQSGRRPFFRRAVRRYGRLRRAGGRRRRLCCCHGHGRHSAGAGAGNFVPYSEGRGRRQQLVSFAPAARSVAQPAPLHEVAPFLAGITATRYSC